MSTVTADFNQWVTVAVDYQISNRNQADLDAAAAKVWQDLDKAVKDAGAVASG